MNIDVDPHEAPQALAADRGYVVQEAHIEVFDGEGMPCWLVYDLASKQFVTEGLSWTTIDEVMTYLEEASA